MLKFSCVVITGLLLLGILSGCGSANAEKTVLEFEAILDNAATAENIDKANDYLEGRLSKLNDEQAGSLLLDLEAYAANYDADYLQYDDLVKRYKGEIPGAMAELFELKAIEQKAPILKDATLQLSWADLLERAMAVEEFIRANQEDLMVKEDALWLYRRYVNALLMGASNSPVFDYGTHAFSPEAQAAYDVCRAEYPGSAVAQILAEYEKYLDGLGYELRYEEKEESAKFFETCSRLVSEAEKQVYSAGSQ
ncbi:MAG: hypothetical protein LBT26_03710 [Clostridiales Family XIII bacterium]|nr:hypothetical protein [Clostridiales Family XIII bacterium]